MVAEEAIEGVRSATVEDHQVARLKFDSLRWYAGKLLPKTYGELGPIARR